jgi:hypothetical protein
MAADETRKMEEMLDNLRADAHPLREYKEIGRRGPRRIDGIQKAGGSAEYTMDIQLPGMLLMRFLTSPHPHAAIQSMDTHRAEALPGVRAVLRYDDPELPRAADLGGHQPSLEPVIPRIARFQGQEVGAAVAAETEAIAEQALTLIDVEWEERPFVLDPEAALAPGAPLANPELLPRGNHYNEDLFDVIEQGDVKQGFAEAEAIIEFDSRRRLHTWAAPERPCGVFRWNGDCAEVWVKQQRPHIAKRAIASWFGGIPMNKIQIHCPYQGASFGGWSQVSWNMAGHYCAAVLARRTGRPVKWTFTRREDFFGGEMDEGFYRFKVGAKRDGTITAVEGTAILANQLWPVFHFLKHLVENTRIPNISGKVFVVITNKGPNVPTRCEQNANTHSQTLIFDHVAAELGLDPTLVALENDGADGHDLAWLDARKAERGFEVRDSLRECVERGKAAIDWDRNWHPPGARRLRRQDARPGLHLGARVGRFRGIERDGDPHRAQRRDGEHPRHGQRQRGGRRELLLPDRRRRAGDAPGGRLLQPAGRRGLLQDDARHVDQPVGDRFAIRQPARSEAADPRGRDAPHREDPARRLPAGLPGRSARGPRDQGQRHLPEVGSHEEKDAGRVRGAVGRGGPAELARGPGGEDSLLGAALRIRLPRPDGHLQAASTPAPLLPAGALHGGRVDPETRVEVPGGQRERRRQGDQSRLLRRRYGAPTWRWAGLD